MSHLILRKKFTKHGNIIKLSRVHYILEWYNNEKIPMLAKAANFVLIVWNVLWMCVCEYVYLSRFWYPPLYYYRLLHISIFGNIIWILDRTRCSWCSYCFSLCSAIYIDLFLKLLIQTSHNISFGDLFIEPDLCAHKVLFYILLNYT